MATKSIQILTKWRNFAKSGYTGDSIRRKGLSKTLSHKNSSG